MGPPREHGGMERPDTSHVNAHSLQWGRRVNTAEWACPIASANVGRAGLQWGRRVNTAECERR